ncbi:MAG: hypothetical protein Q8O00_06740, partial [Holophaga sp.]|nr:hypothetical protein [Holophaga sp.]
IAGAERVGGSSEPFSAVIAGQSICISEPSRWLVALNHGPFARAKDEGPWYSDSFGPFFEVVMLCLRISWRYLAASAALGVISLALGCGGKTPVAPVVTPKYSVTGTVKYTRIPLLTDPTTGVPLGLETDPAKFVELPSRGITVRALTGKSELDAGGNPVMVWSVAEGVLTDAFGNYTISDLDATLPVCIEVLGNMQATTGNPVRLIAADIGTSVPIVDRPVYALRKGVDGSSPAGNPVPSATLSANATVNFNVGVGTKWWLSSASPSLVQSSVLETVGSGSRILGILDSAYSFASTYGEPTPGTILNLHYLAGSTWSFGTRPSFVEYDRTVYPASFDGSSLLYCGAIRVEGGLDDTWNEAALFTLFARNQLVSQRFTGLLPTQALPDRTDLQDLSPEMAIIEGLAPTAAAVLLKSPYLVKDFTATPPSYQDVRVTAGLGSDAYSAGNISALAWEIALKCNTLPSPGVPTDWARLDPLASKRFFLVAVLNDTTNNPTDAVSIYSQIQRLKEVKSGTDTVDLLTIFTDPVITALLGPFNITWPRPTAGIEAGYLVDLGTDPDFVAKPFPAFTLSMANAHENRLGVFPNFSKGEVFRARFLLTKDRKYRLTVQTPGGIPVGAQIEVKIGGSARVFSSTVSSVDDFTLTGNTTAVYQSIQVRLLSPTVRQPDLPITLKLIAQN